MVLILILMYVAIGYFYADWFMRDPAVKKYCVELEEADVRNMRLIAWAFWPPLAIRDIVLILASIFPPGPH